jgi:LacI family transcriptional regulator
VDQNPTIYEVAERADVSIATVSRALQGKGNLRPETRDRVLRAADELGYVPSATARELATKRSYVLGLAFPDLDDPGVEDGHETLLYSDEVIRGMERAARAAGYAVLIAATHRTSDPGFVVSLATRTDGMVVLSRTIPAEQLEQLSRRVPVVLLAGPRDPDRLDHVSVANAQGSAAVTEHVVRTHGHQDVAFVGGPADSPDAAARFEGHRWALGAAGMAVPEEPAAAGDFTEASGARAVERLLARSDTPPRALVCANDQMAVGAMAALARAGLSVPGEVAVTGFDDIQLSRIVTPGLTTVHQPMRRLGACAVELLLRRIDDPDAGPDAVVLATQLVVRASCGCADPARGP